MKISYCFVLSVVFVLCVPQFGDGAVLGEGCTTGPDCTDPGAVCSSSTSGTCVCDAGYYENGGACSLKADLDAGCTLITGINTCLDANAYCVNVGGTNKCQCKSTYFDTNGSGTGGSCAATADLGDVCTRGSVTSTSVQCQDANANCVDPGSGTFTCQCSSNYFDDNGGVAGGACAAKADLDAGCTLISGINTCSDTNANCVDVGGTNKCQCKPSYFDTDGSGTGGSCAATADLGDVCTRGSVTSTSVQCQDANANCVDTGGGTYRCQCSSNYFDDNGGGTGGACAAKADLDAGCTLISGINTCSDTNANCVDVGGTNKCQCKPSYFDTDGSGTGGSCAATADLGDVCTRGSVTSTSVQCQDAFANCVDTGGGTYRCQCSSNYFDDNGGGTGGACAAKADLDAGCTLISGINTCSDTNANCVDVGGTNKCQCKPSYFDTDGSGTGGSCAATADLGDVCTRGSVTSTSVQCQDANANCVDPGSGTFTCRCASNYFDDNGGGTGGACAAKADLDAGCTLISGINTCSDTNANCVDVGGTNKCQCKPSYFDTDGSGTGGSCAATADLGDVCTRGSVTSTSVQCQDANANCVDTGGGTYRCQCSSNYFDDNGGVTGGACAAKADLDAGCTLISGINTCSDTNANCVDVGGTNKCQCKPSYFDTDGSGTGGSCAATADLGDVCTRGSVTSTSVQCQDANANCVDPGSGTFTCRCASNYFDDNGGAAGGACAAMADLGDGCTRGSGVSAFVPCIDTYAECVVVVGSYKCRCISSYFDDNGGGAGGSCTAKVDLGSSCPQLDACDTVNAICNEGGTCVCLAVYYDSNTASTQGGTCEQKVGLGSSCPQPDACGTGNAVCTGGTCVCSSGYYDSNTASNPGGTCELKVGLGSSCPQPDACATGNAECNGGRMCTCSSGYYDSNSASTPGGTCVQKVALGSPCPQLDACGTLNAVCQGGTCACISGYYDSNTASTPGGACVQKVDLGVSCPQLDACSTVNAECNGGTCVCSSGYYDSNTAGTQGGNCELKKLLDATCDGSLSKDIKQCEDVNAGCKFSSSAHTCQCNQGYHWEYSPSLNKKICIPDKPLGADCTLASECSDPAALCRNTCYCNTSHYDDNGWSGGGNCRPVSELMVRDITFSDIKTTSFTVSWSVPTAGSGHVSSYSVSLVGGQLKDVGTRTSVTSAELSTEIVAGQAYTIVIKTFNTGTEVGATRSTSNSKQQATVPNKPGQITNGSDFDARDNTIMVKWSASVGKVSGYTVKLFNGDNVVVTHDTPTSAPQASLSSADLKNGFWYNITIKANSEKFDVDKTVPSELHTEMIQTVVQAPQKPSNIAVKDITETSFTVSWEVVGVSPGDTSYTVTAHADSPAASKTVLVQGFTTSSAMVSGLEEYWNYNVTVRASTSKGDNTSDTTVSYRTVSAPPGVVSSFSIETPGGDYTKLAISWKIPTILERNGLITHYKFIHNGNDLIVNATGVDSVYTKTVPVVPEQQYNFTVYAVNSFDQKGTEKTEPKTAPAGVPKNTVEVGDVEVIPASKLTAVGQTTFRITILEAFLVLSEYGQPQVTGLVACAQSKCDFTGLDGQSKDEFDKLPKWSEAKNNGYTLYRVTKSSWRADTGTTRRRKRAAGEIQYDVGVEKCTDPNVYCNGALAAETPYIVKVVVCTNGGCLYSKEYGPFITKAVLPEDPDNLGAIIGGVVGAVVVIAIVVFVVVFLYRRRSKEKGTTYRSPPRTDPIPPDDSNQNIQRKRPVRLDRFEEYLVTMHKDSNLQFSAEYEELKAVSPKHPSESADLEENRAKNRYINILPFDHTRVKLFTNGEDDKEDFINANYLPGYKSKREYIGCQGPLPGTIEDFWRMIWEQNVSIIVMLTLCKEGQKVKCEQYWPTELADPKQYGDVIVEVTSQSTIQKYDFRMMKIKCGSVERKLKHFHFLSWLDFQANVKHDIILDFINHVRGQVQPPDTAGPMVVHCSAGVGRTGTYIAIEYLMQFIDEHDFSKEVDIFDLVLKMRENRAHMVQTEQQYIFIHDCVVELMERKKKAMEPDDHTYENQAFRHDDENDQEQSLYENMSMKTEL